MSFPHHDTAWASTAEFVRSRLAAPDRVLAPEPFRLIIPRTERYAAANGLAPSAFTWIVVHKGQLADFPRPFLTALTAAAQPVFANEVFVVFTTAPKPNDENLSASLHVHAFHAHCDSLSFEASKSTSEVRRPDLAALSLRKNGTPVTSHARGFSKADQQLASPYAWLAPCGVPGQARERAFQDEVNRLVADYLGTAKNLAVLSIGCGRTCSSDVLSEATIFVRIDVAELSFSEQLPRRAGQSLCVFACMDATRLAFDKSSFDAVLLIDTLASLMDPAAALAEAARVLVRGGKMIVAAANKESLPQRALRRLGLPALGGAFSTQELAGMLRAVGLTVIRSDGILFSPGWALPGFAAGLAPLEGEPEFVEDARILGRRCGPDYAQVFAVLAQKTG